MSQSSALAYLGKNSDRFQAELMELVRIPSISNDSTHKDDIDKAAQWLANKLRSIGINNVQILPTQGFSVVYGEWLNGGVSAPTVLIYGHYDVQFPEPLEDWKSQPFEPVISKNLSAFLIEHQEKLSSTISLNTDAGGFPDENTPVICYSLRGGASFVLEVFGPDHDIHSGEFGGVIQNPIHVLSKLIASLHDEHGHITLPGFYDKVRKVDEDEHAELAKLPFDEAFLLKHSGAPSLWGEPEFIPAERIGARPTFEVVQFEAGQPKSAIPAKAMARISFRLVPDQDPEEVRQQFQKYVEENLPSTVTWNLQFIIGNPALITAYQSTEIQAMSDALQTVFGKAPIFVRGGGGIGAVLKFKQILGVDSILTGFSLPDDNFHGPNEKLHLPTWKKGMAALVHFFHNLVDDK